MNYRLSRFLGVLRHPYTEYQVTKAKNLHRREHPACAACECERDPVTGKKNDVHHKVPVHVAPDQATTPANFITLCRHCHFVWGHAKNWKHWNTVSPATAARVLQILRRMDQDGLVNTGAPPYIGVE